MPTLENVCKRLFADSSWFIKSIVGALLLIFPVVNFVVFGYLYELIARARRGEEPELPEWDEWRRLFVNGVPVFIILMVLGVAPIAVAWLFTWPMRVLGYGAFVLLPVMPAVMLAGPLTAAAIYQYQKREDYRDAFRLPVLVAMLRSSKARFWVPTFALVGFFTACYPLLTFTAFTGLAAGWTYYASYFRFVEEARKTRARG